MFVEVKHINIVSTNTLKYPKKGDEQNGKIHISAY